MPRPSDGKQTLAQRTQDTATRQEVLLLVSEDWFAASHFLPLISEIVACGQPVRVLTRLEPGGAAAVALRAAGAELEPFEFGRNTLAPVKQAAVVHALRARIKTLRPVVVHAVSQHVIVLAGLALSVAPRTKFVMHLTGRGVLATARGAKATAMRNLLRATVRGHMRRGARLLVENLDDASDVIGPAAGDMSRPGAQQTVFVAPGAGVDPNVFQGKKPPNGSVMVAAGVGRMLAIKGWLVFASAVEELRAAGNRIDARVFGASDSNPAAIAGSVLAAWQSPQGPLSWRGPTSDVPGVWAQSDVAVVPTLGGEGVPRSLIEAAACARPLVVTDVPGCRDFVRDGIEGLIVPPGDADALANALRRLIGEPALRAKMGAAARRRVLDGYTEADVRTVYRSVYQSLHTLPDEA